MFTNRRRMVLTENKATSPRYSLSYGRAGLSKSSKKLSYDIVSSLTKDRDLILEVNSSLFFDSHLGDKEKIVEEIVAKLCEMNIDYKYRKHSYAKKKRILGISIPQSQTQTEHELLIFIPNHLWVKDGFWEFIPEFGVTYHVLRQNTDGPKLLEDIHTGRLMDKAIREYYETTIFDYFSFERMGIDTNLSKQEVEECLSNF